MKRTILIALAIAAAACDRSEHKGSEAVDVQAASRSAADDTKPAADNTKLNERDRTEPTLTPGDQGENEADRTITQHIRQAIVGNDALSMTAENVKVITTKGIVTLRGPVKTAQERSEIESIAQRVAGVTRVDNQLEITSQ
jgi:osmotically-inducible protein OsmY